MSRHAFLHIGMQKTGTTSIQRFLSQNRKELHRRGFLYPKTPGLVNHVALANAAMCSDRETPLRWERGIYSVDDVLKLRKTLAHDLKHEMWSSQASVCIFSNEHCSARLHERDEVRWVYDLLHPLAERITLVIYLRRQDEYLVSCYSQTIKSGGTKEFRIPTHRNELRQYDYELMLSRWVEVFGRENIICRRFEKRHLTGGDSLEDFIAVTDIPADGLVRPSVMNPRLDWATLEYLRRMNSKVPAEGRGELVNELERFPQQQANESMPPGMSAFLANFDASNDRVARDYFNDAKLFSTPVGEAEAAASLTMEKVEAITSWLMLP